MKRKINRVGANTLTVSLPSVWVKKHHLRAGQEINLEESSTGLLLSAERSISVPKTAQITIPSVQHFAKRLLFLPYVKGFEEIRVNFHDKETFEKIQQTAALLPGFEITEQGSDYCIIRAIAEEDQKQFEIMFKKLIFTVKLMGDELIEALYNNDWKKLSTIQTFGFSAHRMDIFCRRIINKGTIQTLGKETSLYFACRTLEGITDDYNDICIHLLAIKKPFSKEINEMIKIVNKHYEYFMKVYLENKKEESVPFRERTNQIIKDEFLPAIQKSKYPLVATYCLFQIIKMEEIIEDSVW